MLEHRITFSPKKLLLALACAAVSGVAQGIGLGEISYSTRLGEPLNAKIDLIEAKEILLNNLRISQLSVVEAQEIGVELVYSPYVFQFEVVEQQDERRVLISSNTNITEPYIDLMVRLDWPGGSVFREYAILLDVPSVGVSTVAENSVDQARPPENIDAADRYQVRSGDTFSAITTRLALKHHMSSSEMFNWVYQNNRDAFIDGNVNKLNAGVVLRVPKGSIAASSVVEASNTTKNSVPTTSSQDTGELKGVLRLSNNSSNAETQRLSKINEKMDGTQEMIELLSKENEELKRRLEKLEDSEYLSTLRDLVIAQNQQISQLREELEKRGEIPVNVIEPLPDIAESSLLTEDRNQNNEDRPKIMETPPISITAGRNVSMTTYMVSSVVIVIFAFYAAYLWLRHRLREDQGPVFVPYQKDATVVEVELDHNIDEAVDAGLGVTKQKRAKKSLLDRIEERKKHEIALKQNPSGDLRKNSDNSAAKSTELELELDEDAFEPAPLVDSKQPVMEVVSQESLAVKKAHDAEIAELTAMVQIYCKAGKFDDAREIVEAQNKITPDERLVETLNDIDSREKKMRGS